MEIVASRKTLTATRSCSLRPTTHNSPNNLCSLYVLSFTSSRPPIFFFSPLLMVTSDQSQTQSGNRYTPHLTRFYAALGPSLLLPLIQESLEAINVRCKAAPVCEDQSQKGPQSLRLRIGGYDRRKVMFKGWVEVERFVYHGSEGSFCVMQRDIVCINPFFSIVAPYRW